MTDNSLIVDQIDLESLIMENHLNKDREIRNFYDTVVLWCDSWNLVTYFIYQDLIDVVWIDHQVEMASQC
jgi:hypothetical protein